MKRITLFFFVLGLNLDLLSAQDNDYKTNMKEVVESIQSSDFGEDLTPYANQMERIAAVEKKEWLPLYWASFCYMMKAYMEPVNEKKDQLLEKSEQLIATADSLQPKNDEIAVLRANIASARLAVDPMSRWMKYGPISAGFITQAKGINPDNPRIALHEAQGTFYTPEAYGGGKEKALPLIKTAIDLFAKFKPASEIMPNWGESAAQYLLTEAQK